MHGPHTANFKLQRSTAVEHTVAKEPCWISKEAMLYEATNAWDRRCKEQDAKQRQEQQDCHSYHQLGLEVIWQLILSLGGLRSDRCALNTLQHHAVCNHVLLKHSYA